MRAEVLAVLAVDVVDCVGAWCLHMATSCMCESEWRHRCHYVLDGVLWVLTRHLLVNLDKIGLRL